VKVKGHNVNDVTTGIVQNVNRMTETIPYSLKRIFEHKFILI